MTSPAGTAARGAPAADGLTKAEAEADVALLDAFDADAETVAGVDDAAEEAAFEVDEADADLLMLLVALALTTAEIACQLEQICEALRKLDEQISFCAPSVPKLHDAW